MPQNLDRLAELVRGTMAGANDFRPFVVPWVPMGSVLVQTKDCSCYVEGLDNGVDVLREMRPDGEIVGLQIYGWRRFTQIKSADPVSLIYTIRGVRCDEYEIKDSPMSIYRLKGDKRRVVGFKARNRNHWHIAPSLLT